MEFIAHVHKYTRNHDWRYAKVSMYSVTGEFEVKLLQTISLLVDGK